jgi:glycosyltransferase involved in cell wall biosynthesis
LIQALPAVRADAPDARVLLAGTGPREPALRELVRELKLEEAVSFLGHRKDIPHLMAAADAFVLPSRFEGHPIVVLEAMAAGLPVIATDVCGTSEAIDANVTGLLVPPEDPEALASAMQLVLARPSVARRLAVRARSSVTQNFSAAVMAHKTLAIYRAMLTEAQI